ncbi:thioredoxin-dependent thiol peroxidase [Hyphococcus flavus]|uniref:thioredoxin-dependent peroxiredoxin n=1 Tax=Hyphococcus flavus TaxID=1866326 RepID=A0AAE9ZFU9_9PROT|nr:thioredoxin-dependent thiol peroxidase [Hyphococcus flavus]WDI31997.1 thioredoxin-dependent thiol peroxidase [Hyphococcus flavus]
MAKALVEGVKAPAFSITLDDGELVKSKDLIGKKIVLYFYPKDDTPGCTKEAIAFTEDIAKFKRAGATVIGVSRDTVAKHQKFKEKYSLKVLLGADEDGKVTEKFGVWVEKNMYGRKYMGIERSTFLIDEKGVIRKIWRKVKVPGHAEAALAEVKAL